MTKELTKQDKELIEDEVVRYEKTHEAITKEKNLKYKQFSDDGQLARELTSQIVNARRDEDKQALQSDESVAHGLAKLRKEQSHGLSLLEEQPYFARVVYHEKGRDVEFKLGIAGFPEQRIIDWRKAPISRLYYDYEEGAHFETEIAGLERTGDIKLRRAYVGKKNILSSIELKEVSFVQSHGTWHRHVKSKTTTFSLKDKEKIKKLLKEYRQEGALKVPEEQGYLQQILSLLTPEQFCLISTETDKPVIIHGSAGTGKTTVALHRLAWLLFEGNSEAKEESTLVVVYNNSLKAYVKHVLPELGINNVSIVTFREWATSIISQDLGRAFQLERLVNDSEILEYKASIATHERLISYIKAHHTGKEPPFVLLDFFHQDKDRQGGTIKQYLGTQIEKRWFDQADLALLLAILDERKGYYSSTKYPTRLKYLVIDEAQDFSSLEIRVLLNALEDKKQLTLAGDMGQKIYANTELSSWEQLLCDACLPGVDVLNLKVAYRSTYQIYELAESIRNPHLQEEELEMTPKFGPEPVLTITHTFSDAVQCAKNWLDDVLGKNRQTIGAVICESPLEARQLYDALIKLGTRGIRLGDEKHFAFTPGITVTDVKQVKGLEFSSVLIFNPSHKNYPSSDHRARNMLYVAVTRAAFRLDLISYETPSFLMPDFLRRQDLTRLDAQDDGPLFSDTDQDLSRFQRDEDDIIE
ncbi:MAG: UvrD-helicase domain-containing protein [bacterium]|nr:AAA family ATPase [bacterium]MBU1917034.1 AAA family ATPase [bacterium]